MKAKFLKRILSSHIQLLLILLQYWIVNWGTVPILIRTVPGKTSCADAVRYDKKTILSIGDSHMRKINWKKLQN